MDDEKKRERKKKGQGVKSSLKGTNKKESVKEKRVKGEREECGNDLYAVTWHKSKKKMI